MKGEIPSYTLRSIAVSQSGEGSYLTRTHMHRHTYTHTNRRVPAAAEGSCKAAVLFPQAALQLSPMRSRVLASTPKIALASLV